MKNRVNLEGLIMKEIQNMKHDANKVERFKNGMLRGGVSRGEAQRMIMGKTPIGALEDNVLCLMSVYLFGLSGNEMIHPKVFFSDSAIQKVMKEVVPIYEITRSKKLYNEETKEMFLESGLISPETAKSYRRIFTKSSIMEKVLDKDLYSFNKEELEEFFFDLNPKTTDASGVYGRIVTTYINWAVVRGFINNNPLETVNTKYFSKFVDKTRKLYFTDREMMMIEDNCENAQDAVIFALIFSGAYGKDLSELRNLKREDVNFDTGELLLTDDDGSTRTIIVDDHVLRIIRQAINQREYYKRNGQMEQVGNMRDFTELVESNYVLRNSKTKTESTDGVNSTAIYRRIKTISETIDIHYLTGKNVLRSGMIFMAKELFEEEGRLDSPQYAKISKRFSVVNIYQLKTFCNTQTIHELYRKGI